MNRILRIGIGFALAALLMWLLFRGVHWHDLVDAIEGINPIWLAVAQLPVWGAFFTRVQRWSYIVRAVHSCKFKNLLVATQLMFLWNVAIGMRVGEFVRPVVLNRLENIPLSKGLAMGALDRVTDLIGLMVIVGVAVLFFHPTDDIVLPPGVFGIENPPEIPANLIPAGGSTVLAGLTGVVALLVMLYVRKALALRLTHAIFSVVSERLADRVCGVLDGFAGGLHVFRSTPDMFKSIAFSLITWGLFVVGLYCLMNAFSIEFAWYAPFVLHALLAFSVSVPGTPGSIGQFHLPLVAGLLMVAPQTEVATMVAFAIVAHLVNLVPVFLLGVYSLMNAPMSIGELVREGGRTVTNAPANESRP